MCEVLFDVAMSFLFAFSFFGQIKMVQNVATTIKSSTNFLCLKYLVGRYFAYFFNDLTPSNQ